MVNRVSAFIAVVTFGVATSGKSLLQEPALALGPSLPEPEHQQVRTQMGTASCGGRLLV